VCDEHTPPYEPHFIHVCDVHVSPVSYMCVMCIHPLVSPILYMCVMCIHLLVSPVSYMCVMCTHPLMSPISYMCAMCMMGSTFCGCMLLLSVSWVWKHSHRALIGAQIVTTPRPNAYYLFNHSTPPSEWKGEHSIIDHYARFPLAWFSGHSEVVPPPILNLLVRKVKTRQIRFFLRYI
jgi:hypothetical protein